MKTFVNIVDDIKQLQQPQLSHFVQFHASSTYGYVLVAHGSMSRQVVHFDRRTLSGREPSSDRTQINFRARAPFYSLRTRMEQTDL